MSSFEDQDWETFGLPEKEKREKNRLGNFLAFVVLVVAVVTIGATKTEDSFLKNYFYYWHWPIACATAGLVFLFTEFSVGKTLISAAILLLILLI